MDDVARACQAGNGCGGCHEVIEDLLSRERPAGDVRVFQIAVSAAKAA